MICGKLHTLKMQNDISLIFISIKLLIIFQNRWFTVPWVLVPFFLFLFTCKSYICFSMLSLTVQSRVTIRCGFVTDWTFLVVVHMYRHSYYYLKYLLLLTTVEADEVFVFVHSFIYMCIVLTLPVCSLLLSFFLSNV